MSKLIETAAMMAQNPKITGKQLAKKLGVSVPYAYALMSKARKAMEVEALREINNPQEMEIVAQWVEKKSPLDVQVGGGHYKDMKIQPVEFITANNLDFLSGCIIKRICRWREKDGLKDLEKIKHEVDLLIELHNLK